MIGTLDMNPQWTNGRTGNYYGEYCVSSADLFGYGYDTLGTMLLFPAQYLSMGQNAQFGAQLNMIVMEATSAASAEDSSNTGQKFNANTSIKIEVVETAASCFLFPNSDKDTSYLTYNNNHYFVYSAPKVLAVLASSPYFEDLMNRDDLSGAYIQSATSYAQTAGSSDGAVAQASIWAGEYCYKTQSVRGVAPNRWSAKLIQYTQAYGTVTATELTDWEIGSKLYRLEDNGTWSNPKEVTEESGTFKPVIYIVTGQNQTLKANVVNTADQNSPGTVSVLSPEVHSYAGLTDGVKIANGSGLVLLATSYEGYQVKQWIVKEKP